MLKPTKKSKKTNTTSTPIKKGKCLTVATPTNTPSQSASTTLSPLCIQNERVPYNNCSQYSVKQSISQTDYAYVNQMVDTLQGSIYKVSKGDNIYIIKVTSKQLHSKHITNWHGEQIKIDENVVQEAAILKYLSQNKPPKSLVKYIDFFADQFNYFFVMEYGGDMSLFELVKKCHQYIIRKLLDIKEWQKFCKLAMQQMVDLMVWLHDMNCCHLDISLENFVVDNVIVTEDISTGEIKFLPGFVVRIIDFGLAEMFTNNNFRCSKYVGKTQYKAPEVYKKKEIFDARKADVFSLSVVFFIMFIGCPPWNKPCANDITFNIIMTGHLQELLVGWNRFKYITPNIFGLLSLLFQEEKSRLTIKEIKRHPWLL